jgi:hypothetical protein
MLMSTKMAAWSDGPPPPPHLRAIAPTTGAAVPVCSPRFAGGSVAPCAGPGHRAVPGRSPLDVDIRHALGW